MGVVCPPSSSMPQAPPCHYGSCSLKGVPKATGWSQGKDHRHLREPMAPPSAGGHRGLSLHPQPPAGPSGHRQAPGSPGQLHTHRPFDGEMGQVKPPLRYLHSEQPLHCHLLTHENQGPDRSHTRPLTAPALPAHTVTTGQRQHECPMLPLGLAPPWIRAGDAPTQTRRHVPVSLTASPQQLQQHHRPQAPHVADVSHMLTRGLPRSALSPGPHPSPSLSYLDHWIQRGCGEASHPKLLSWPGPPQPSPSISCTPQTNTHTDTRTRAHLQCGPRPPLPLDHVPEQAAGPIPGLEAEGVRARV